MTGRGGSWMGRTVRSRDGDGAAAAPAAFAISSRALPPTAVHRVDSGVCIWSFSRSVVIDARGENYPSVPLTGGLAARPRIRLFEPIKGLFAPTRRLPAIGQGSPELPR